MASRTDLVRGTKRSGACILALGLIAATAGCSDDDKTDENPQERVSAFDEGELSPGDGLTFVRSGGSSFELHDADVECGPSDEDETVTVVRLIAPAGLMQHGHKPQSFLVVEAVPGSDGVYELPLDGGDASENRIAPVSLFGVDSEDGNELSGSVEVATGSVSVLEATCDPSPQLSFTIRATLGSEYGDMPTMHVEGGLQASESTESASRSRVCAGCPLSRRSDAGRRCADRGMVGHFAPTAADPVVCEALPPLQALTYLQPHRIAPRYGALHDSI